MVKTNRIKQVLKFISLTASKLLYPVLIEGHFLGSSILLHFQYFDTTSKDRYLPEYVKISAKNTMNKHLVHLCINRALSYMCKSISLRLFYRIFLLGVDSRQSRANLTRFSLQKKTTQVLLPWSSMVVVAVVHNIIISVAAAFTSRLIHFTNPSRPMVNNLCLVLLFVKTYSRIRKCRVS